MAYGCCSDVVRILAIILGVRCLAVLLVGRWLGTEPVAVWPLTPSCTGYFARPF